MASTSTATALENSPVTHATALSNGTVQVPREREPGRLARRRPIRTARKAMVGLGSAGEWVFGVASLVVALSVLATLPILQFLSLGYLLEASGRIVHEGHLAGGLVGVRKAARVGSVVLGIWLVLLPLRFVSLMASSASLMPGGHDDRRWTLALWILAPVVVAHVAGALVRGGRLRHFLWPRPIDTFRQVAAANFYHHASVEAWRFLRGLQLPYYFWLGLRGFVGGLVWLVVPITLLAAGRQVPALGFLGGLLLAVAVLYLPFAQVQFAVENRFSAMFEVARLRNHFRRAPWAHLAAFVATLLFALPLYLLKIEIVPREAAWLPSLVFVAFMFPARLLTGWAYSRAVGRRVPRHWLWRHSARLAMLPVATFYVVIVFFTQFTSWYGLTSLYEQHAFLLPVPFLDL